MNASQHQVLDDYACLDSGSAYFHPLQQGANARWRVRRAMSTEPSQPAVNHGETGLNEVVLDVGREEHMVP